MGYAEDFQAGLAALRQNDAARGQALLTACVRQQPTDAQAWLFLGVALGLNGQSAAAEQAVQRSVALNGSDPRAHYNLGRLQAVRGDRAAAVASYQRALAADAGFGKATEALAQLGVAPPAAPPPPPARPAPPPWEPEPAPAPRESEFQALERLSGGYVVRSVSVRSCMRLSFVLCLLVCGFGALVGLVTGTLPVEAVLGGLLAAAVGSLVGAGVGGWLFNLLSERVGGLEVGFGTTRQGTALVRVDPASAAKLATLLGLPLFVLGELLFVPLALAPAMRPVVVPAMLALGACGTAGAYVWHLLVALCYNLAAKLTGGLVCDVTGRYGPRCVASCVWWPTAWTLLLAALPLMLVTFGLLKLQAAAATNWVMRFPGAPGGLPARPPVHLPPGLAPRPGPRLVRMALGPCIHPLLYNLGARLVGGLEFECDPA